MKTRTSGREKTDSRSVLRAPLECKGRYCYYESRDSVLGKRGTAEYSLVVRVISSASRKARVCIPRLASVLPDTGSYGGRYGEIFRF